MATGFRLAALAAMSFPLSVLCAPNLLPNGSFEALLRESTPRGWRLDGAWRVEREGAAEAKVAMHLPPAESKAWNKLLSTARVEVGRGEKVTVAVQYRSSTGYADIGLEFCDDVGEHVVWCDVVPAAAAAQWRELRREFLISDDLWQRGVRSVRVYLQVSRPNAEAWFDDARLTSSREAAASLAVPGVAGNPLSAGNLAPNPGFELRDVKAPVGYICTPPDGGTWDSESHSGKHALKLTPGQRPAVWRSVPIPISSSVPHRLTAWVRLQNLAEASVVISAVYRGSDPRVFLDEVSAPALWNTVDWYQLPLDLGLPPPGAKAVEFSFALRGGGPGAAWVDDVALHPLAAEVRSRFPFRANLFHKGEEVAFEVTVSNHLAFPDSGVLTCAVRDFHNRLKWTKGSGLDVPGSGESKLTLSPKVENLGWYRVDLSWRAKSGAKAEETVTFAMLTPFSLKTFDKAAAFGSHPHGEPEAMLTAKEGYVKWMRTSIGWEWVEPQRGEWQWEAAEANLKQFWDLGMEPLVILANTPKWASSYREGMRQGAYRSTYGSYPPDSLADWESFCFQTAQHFRGRIRYYEVWNEPNCDFFMGTREQFAELVKGAYRGLKRGDPNCQVMFDCAGVDLSFYEDMFRFGAGDSLDILATHNYQLSEAGPPEATSFHRGYLDMRLLLARHGRPNVPLWDSEFCWMSDRFPGAPWWKAVGETNQANWLVRSYVYALSAGAEKLFWFPFYPYYDSSTSGYHPGSLVNRDLSPKPAFVAYRVLAEVLGGTAFSRWLPLGDNVRCAVFRRGADERAVLWCVRGVASVNLRLRAGKPVLVDAMGQRSAAKVSDGLLKVALSEAPMYVLGVGKVLAPSVQPAPTPPFLCAPLSKPPTVDGDPSEWWADAHPVGLNDELRLGERASIVNDPPVHDCSGEVAVSGCGSTLYVAARVLDDEQTSGDRLTLEFHSGKEVRRLSLDGEGLSATWGSRRPASQVGRCRVQRKEGTTVYEAEAPLAIAEGASAARLALLDHDTSGKSAALRWPDIGWARWLRTWRAADGSYPRVLPSKTVKPGLRRLVTVFPEGCAFRYEVLATNSPHQGNDLNPADWRLIRGPKVGVGTVEDLLPGPVREVRTRLTNLLSNNSFEGPVGTTTTADLDQKRGEMNAWQRDRNYCCLDSTVAHTGKWSAKILATGRTEADRWSNWGQTIPVKSDTTYTVSGYVLIGETTPQCAVSLAIHGYPPDSQKQLNNRHVFARNEVRGWQRLTLTITTAPGVTRLRVWCDVAFDGTAWFDDVHAIEGNVGSDVAEVVEQKLLP